MDDLFKELVTLCVGKNLYDYDHYDKLIEGLYDIKTRYDIPISDNEIVAVIDSLHIE